MHKLRELCADLQYELISGDLDTEISDIVYDSRKIRPGTAFVCMEGSRFDPHKLIPEAFEKGCRVFVISKLTEDVKRLSSEAAFIRCEDTRAALSLMSQTYFDHPARKLRLIGITGTKGKTTTAYMIKAILEASGRKTGLIGTVGCEIGRDFYPTRNTTPESYELQKYFAMMAEQGCTHAVMECSSQGFKLRRVEGLRFDAGIFLNISPDHIGPGEHRDFDEYLWCKSRLLRASDICFYNRDSEHLPELFEMAELSPKDRRFRSFGIDGDDADYRASDIGYVSEEDFIGLSFRLLGYGMSEELRLSMPGKYNVINALAAASVCSYLGVDISDIRSALSRINISGRTEEVYRDKIMRVIVDYAHNEESMRSLILTLRNFRPGRIVVVFGCGGDRSVERRIGMGREAVRHADFTVMTTDNPRTEDPVSIIDDIEKAYLEAGGRKDRYVRLTDRREAIRYAMENALPGDLIAVIGKGHEQYQEINGVRTHFSDQEEILKAAMDISGQGDRT